MAEETDEERLTRLFGMAGWTIERRDRCGYKCLDVMSGDGLSSITVGTVENSAPWDVVFKYAVMDLDWKPRPGVRIDSDVHVCKPFFVNERKKRGGSSPEELAGTGLERAAAACSAEEVALCLCAFGPEDGEREAM